jgi:hypothetical protein
VYDQIEALCEGSDAGASVDWEEVIKVLVGTKSDLGQSSENNVPAIKEEVLMPKGIEYCFEVSAKESSIDVLRDMFKQIAQHIHMKKKQGKEEKKTKARKNKKKKKKSKSKKSKRKEKK